MFRKIGKSIADKFVQFRAEAPDLGVHVAIGVVLASLLVIYKWISLFWQHLAMALTAILLMHLFDYYLLGRRLVRNIRSTVDDRLDNSNALLLAASNNGITRIYNSRSKVWDEVKMLLEQPLRKEELRIWAVGISLSESFGLGSFLDTVSKMQLPSKHVRISLLDAVSGAGVFRDCLENSLARVKAMVVDDSDDFLDHHIWEKFQDVRRLFKGGYQDYQKSVRFYNHTPLCWMIIVNDIAFYQPYTFGGIYRDEDQWNIGSDMPIFRIENLGSDTKTFMVLQDHAEKLWQSSDITYLLVEARRRAHVEEDLVRSIFQARGDWFRWIYDSLTAAKNPQHGDVRTERRVQIREPLEICWDCSSQKQRALATLINYSSNGLGIEVDPSQRGPAITEQGKNARVKFGPTQGKPSVGQSRRSSDVPAKKLWEYHLSQFDNRDFRIVYIDSKRQKMGLQLAG